MKNSSQGSFLAKEVAIDKLYFLFKTKGIKEPQKDK